MLGCIFCVAELFKRQARPTHFAFTLSKCFHYVLYRNAQRMRFRGQRAHRFMQARQCGFVGVGVVQIQLASPRPAG